MAANNSGQKEDKKPNLGRRIVLIEIVIIIIPALSLLYVIHEGRVILPMPTLLLLSFTFILIISGIFILRNVINHFITILMAVKAVDTEGVVNLDIKQDIAELRDVRNSLGNIMTRLDDTAAELSRRSYELLALKELIEVAKKSLDIQSLQELVLDKIMAVTGARIGSFLEYEATAHQFRIAAVRGMNEKNVIDFYIPLEDSMAKYAVLEKKSVLIRDIWTDYRTQRVNDDRYGSPSFLSIPVVLGNDVSAVVNLAGKLPDDYFDEDDERISRLMIEEIDFALKNARLHHKVQELLKASEESNNRLQEEIKKRIESEEQLFHYQKNLEHVVEERTREIVTINEKLTEEISEHKSAQKALQESEEMLRTIIDSARDWIFIKDMVSRYALVNQRMAADLGKSEAEILGKTAKDIFLDQEAILIEEWDQKIFDGEIVEFETSFVIGGKQRVFYIIKVPVRDKSGQIISLCGIARDITERKKMETQLMQAEKMEALGNMAGGVAHDLNNILGVLVGYSELFLAEIAADSPHRDYANTILKSSEKGAVIIQDLLTLARRGVSSPEIVNLNQTISDYLATPEFERLKDYHPLVTFRTNLGKELFNVKGSPVHLYKTVMNLVSNAAEAVSGVGEVKIQTENRFMDIPLRGHPEMQKGDYAVLKVSDTGIGISADDIGKIFEPFYTKKVMGRSGTGLGLAVVWGTMKDHNGYIDLQSKEGKGTTFTLYFPVTREKLVKVEKSASSATYMSKGESILVVDDQPEQRALATSILERLGYQVEDVESGEKAIEYLKNKNADLIILDMIMDPGIDGLETYRKILEINPRQKAIIVSGYSETERVNQTLELGAGQCIRKPYTIETLGLSIRKKLAGE